MRRWDGVFLRALAAAATALLAACQASAPVRPQATAPNAALHFDLADSWGGDLQCRPERKRCLLAAVEHEESRLALIELTGRQARRLDAQPLAYHPDSAAWLADDLLAAAVEASASLDIFRVVEGRLVRVHQVALGFSPRDVVRVSAADGSYQLLATPYSGDWVAWVDWRADGSTPDRVQRTTWCRTPWHPVHVDKLPGEAAGGHVVACLDGKKVVAVSDANPRAAPHTLAEFDAVARQARPSPSGRWLYVALETGERNARIDLRTGELQWIAGTRKGSAAAAALGDNLVLWGEDMRLRLQRLDDAGQVLESRVLPTSGFSTDVLLRDIDGDGEVDAVVLNSTGKRSDVIYGPLWDRAAPLH
ncbi:MAG: hypothetical protein ABS45_14440 [Comamonas sp. SCN 65-56]|uniref:hypothetical protein n=1 Tax=Comamonas sp. SCN 65-56 TaxID=1660095 RepID=UPI00086BBB1C|nr:hypothetical protein [Comamonas sp. SCN 65-56]ODS90845.1 MAG: hypothetical protein ABS45_14440 [Comamonas sp. SCN 65-56]